MKKNKYIETKNEITNLKIKDFFEQNYIDFATYSSYRSIASYVDGLKNSQRKVIWVVEKFNIVKETKILTLASKTMDEAEYLHGDMSMNEVVTNLAKNYPGTNNLNLLYPEGHFGHRNNNEAAAPRYIMTHKEKYFNEIFVKDDKHIWNHQLFEGKVIEPKYLLPILPLILINGSVGIGTGFSQKILPRNPKRIIEILKNYLKKSKGFREIVPSINGFKGKIYKDSDNPKKIYYEGNYKIKNTTTIIIDEIPMTYDLVNYRKILEKLIENKIIKNYKDESNENEFYFEIKCERSLLKQSKEYILNTFELIKSEVENFTTITENNNIRVFNNEKELMMAFIDFRLDKYEERRLFLINKLEMELLVVSAKYLFIKAILDKKIIINNRKKDEIIKDLEKNKFHLVDDSYNYLLNMHIYHQTIEEYNKLKELEQKLKDDIKVLEALDNKKMWLKDLENLKI